MKKLLKLTLLMGILVVLGTSTSYAASKTVNYPTGNKLRTTATIKKAAKTLGLKKKKSKKFELYYSGKKVVIGRNTKRTAWPRKLLYVKNTGNKKLLVYGIKIGDTKTSALKKLRKRGITYYADLGSSVEVGPYYDGYVLKFKKNKLSSWTYNFQYTS